MSQTRICWITHEKQKYFFPVYGCHWLQKIDIILDLYIIYLVETITKMECIKNMCGLHLMEMIQGKSTVFI